MLEGSTVLWGANENTPFTGIKAEQHAKDRIDTLERIFKSGNFDKDESFELLYREIERLKAIIEPGLTHLTEPTPIIKAFPKLVFKL